MTETQTGSVRFEGVVKKYGDVTALKKFDLAIEPGKLVTLLGPSGCGKTTTLRLIAGLEMATKGKIFIGDTEVTADTLAPKLSAIAQSRQSEAETKDQRVRVRGDKGVNYGLVMRVIGELNASGFRRIDLLSNPQN